MGFSDRLLVSRTGRVLVVEFNRPPRHYFDAEMSAELDEFTRRLRGDCSVGAVLFTGHGDHYLTHFDVPELIRGSESMPFAIPYGVARAMTAVVAPLGRSVVMDRLASRTPAHDLVLTARIYASLRRMNRSDKVFVTAINGLALGMGCVFALACDLRLMADDQRIGLPEAGLGMLAAAGGTQRLTRMAGSGRALELLLEGRWLSAPEAVELGLVNHAVPREELLDRALETAHRLARRSAVVNREIKRSVYETANFRAARANRREAASLVTTVTSEASRRCLNSYQNGLTANPDPSDEYLAEAWHPLLTAGVPQT